MLNYYKDASQDASQIMTRKNPFPIQRKGGLVLLPSPFVCFSRSLNQLVHFLKRNCELKTVIGIFVDCNTQGLAVIVAREAHDHGAFAHGYAI